MRYLPLFFIAGLCASAQDFLNGQASRIVIGQPTFTEQKPQPASQYVLGGVGGLIAVSSAGEAACSFTTPAMYRGTANRDGRRVAIYSDELER